MTAAVVIFPDLKELYWKAAEEFSRLAQASTAASGIFNVALSGGSTPEGLYSLLADKSKPFFGRIPWQKLHVFWGDERCVPPDHAESNYRMAYAALLSRVPVPAGSIHRI